MCCLQSLTALGTRMHRGSSLLWGPLAVPASQARPRLLTFRALRVVDLVFVLC